MTFPFNLKETIMDLTLRQKTMLRACALVVTALLLFPGRRACAEPVAPAHIAAPVEGAPAGAAFTAGLASPANA